MYCELLNKIVSLENLLNVEKLNDKIILHYVFDGKLITDELDYQDIRIDPNSEEQQIDKDFSLIKNIIANGMLDFNDLHVSLLQDELIREKNKTWLDKLIERFSGEDNEV